MTSLLADTQIVLWALDDPERLPRKVRRELEDPDTQPMFSVISIWEIAIKANLKRTNLDADAREVRATLLRDGWRELEFSGEHAIVAGNLPRLHGDPFDRALVAQASVEQVELVTRDKLLCGYGKMVRTL